MINLSEYLKNLSILSVATLLLGMSYPADMGSFDFSSTQPAAPAKTAAQVKVPMALPRKQAVTAPLYDPSLMIATINKVFNARKIPQLMVAANNQTNANATCADCSAAKVASDIR